jgi:hypothetical protein
MATDMYTSGDLAALRMKVGKFDNAGAPPRPITAYLSINWPKTAFNVTAMISKVVGTRNL